MSGTCTALLFDKRLTHLAMSQALCIQGTYNIGGKNSTTPIYATSVGNISATLTQHIRHLYGMCTAHARHMNGAAHGRHLHGICNIP